MPDSIVQNPTSKDFFEAKYRSHIDPWSFASSSYEQSRYGLLLDALQGRRYAHAFEPGCSIGVFTSQLARLCDWLEASDISRTAVAAAKLRCKDQPHVSLRTGSLPEDIPQGPFDLIVLSEIGYYFTKTQLAALLKRLAEKLNRPGTLLVSHWLGHSTDHLLTGDEVHTIAAAVLALPPDLSRRQESFRFDLWQLNA